MSAALEPVAGTAREVYRLLHSWYADESDSLSIRTSGSSGEPKIVRLSRGALLASARASIDRLGGPGQWLCALPPTGVGGLQVLLRSILADVEPVFDDEHLSFGEAIGAMSADRRYVSLVPTQLFRLVESGGVSSLAEVDAVLLGGAAADRSLVERAREAGVRIVRTYGMTETCGGCVYDGVPLDGVSMRIGVQGQVEIAGPVLFDGYADAPRTEPWFVTGDLGRIDDGRLTVLGRADDIAVTGGVNVPLAVVEALALELDEVDSAVAVAVADAEWGQRIVLAVESGDPEVLREKISARARDTHRARAWVPREVRIVGPLPLLPGGKIDRRAVEALVRGA